MRELIVPYVHQRIYFDRERVNHLVIENPRELRKFLYRLRGQLEGEEEYLTFYQDQKGSEISKCCCLIDNPFQIEMDEKKLDLQIQKEISSKISLSQKEGYEVLLNQISDYLDSLTYDYSLPVTFNRELTLANLLKAFSLGYSSTETNYLSLLLHQIQVLINVFHYSMFCFLNLSDYLTQEEIRLLQKELRYLEVDYFLVSSHLPIRKFDGEFLIRIDEDLCEIVVENENEKN